MNRIVLIGNGFDLAHGLPTKYEDFINWYWDQRVKEFSKAGNISKDCLCTFEIEQPYTWYGFYGQIFSSYSKPKGKDIIESILNCQYGIKMKHSFSPFFQSIINSIETKGWVDIENEYYNMLVKCTIGVTYDTNLDELNDQFRFLTERLVDFLKSVNSNTVTRIDGIWDSIYSPIKPKEVSIEGKCFIEQCVNYWLGADEQVIHEKIDRYGLIECLCINNVKRYKECVSTKSDYHDDYPQLFMLPDNIMLLNFNYTDTANSYRNRDVSVVNHIHGELQNPNGIIFGYGDELDDKYEQLKALNNNECLRNIKSIKYLESDNYRKVLGFIESAPFQVLIMGHSCGNSDRTLLNTLFEHKNCISIKPYYHQKADGSDNYLDLIQNISRNFTDMKLMRDRVVNKTFCEPLAQAK